MQRIKVAIISVLVAQSVLTEIFSTPMQIQCQPGIGEGSVADQQTRHGRQRFDAIEVSQLKFSCLISHFSDNCCFC